MTVTGGHDPKTFDVGVAEDLSKCAECTLSGPVARVMDEGLLNDIVARTLYVDHWVGKALG